MLPRDGSLNTFPVIVVISVVGGLAIIVLFVVFILIATAIGL